MVFSKQHHIFIVFQKLELEIGIGGNLREILPVLLPEADHTQLCLTGCQQFQRFLGVGLPDHRIDALGFDQRNQVLADHMKGGCGVGNTDPEAVAFCHTGAHGFDGIHLPQDVMGMLQEGHAPFRGADTLMGTVKNRKADSFLHFTENPAQVGLTYIQILGRLRNGAHPLDLDHILQMLDVHNVPSCDREICGLLTHARGCLQLSIAIV